ncbi:MAG TPA: ABC transporter permease subunit [Pirellulales bacterium]|jgi:ABC-type transport system involved in multi-copper enzyme maturation permease subunit|nr:ABC transporter permease subunit [Pirellulales bacterium]
MFGPILGRETVTAARSGRLHVARGVYVGMLVVLASTAWQMLTGTQIVRGVGDVARFGSAVFQVLAPVQLVLVSFGAAVWSVLAVAHEKDRRTLLLLLTTRLGGGQMMAGKWLASAAIVLSIWLAALPFLMLCTLLGGVGYEQLARTQVVTVASILCSAALGTLLAYWREKTFQSLALAVVMLIAWTVAWELLARTEHSLGALTLDEWAALASPWHALDHAANPLVNATHAEDDLSVAGFCLVSAALSAAMVAAGGMRLRAWNTTSEVRQPGEGSAAATQSSTAAAAELGARRERAMWDNPILWREIRTWAQGRRTLLLRVLYVALFALSAWGVVQLNAAPGNPSRLEFAVPLAPVMILSLLLINAQAVTSITSERDSQALDLLLVSDLTSKEFVFGKLAGALWNAKEMVVLPTALVVYLHVAGPLDAESTVLLTAGWLVVCAFSAVLGFHCGLSYTRSRSAIGVSLGTILFLAIGIATTMRILTAFSGSFAFQLQPFLATIVGGGVGLYAVLGARNPSPATFAAALFCPVATFYALTSFLLGHTLAVFLAVASAYGFTVAAMLVPAVYEFDAITGRAGQGHDETAA